ncbi:P-loop containing nucleoside triphosphate hydrolase protein [Boletus edulis BED1]|uniref:P-loop containing nucleoside triphosphate hydrolase protein n=1 Tax=Boletus edulis BED1 TaxID=1328754 RepID=A0AAD4BXE6_BOLED|nr:P-loop containing nucleoside triphosphate hydrolase protein [Boletus edulis BED1]
MSTLQNRVILIGVGGATCSGKTTLAKHFRDILPNSIIIHQDDFAPPEELIPIHPVHNVADWDAPQGAIDWPRLQAFLKDVKENGVIPPDHRSHDHMNEQKDVPITEAAEQELRTRFEEFENEQRKKGIRVMWGLVDGFLLYWDKGIIDQLDIRFFLRLPHDVLKQRRHERHGYHTAVQFNPEGSLWRDPPMYWEHIVYPAYIEAHQDMFENADVENGKPTGQRVPGLVVIEPVKKGAEMSIDDIVRRCCDVLEDFLRTP